MISFQEEHTSKKKNPPYTKIKEDFFMVQKNFCDPCTAPLCCREAGVTFCFHKIDAITSKSLSGATFQLENAKGIVATSTSDHHGQVQFCDITPGLYTMRETQTPVGYRPNLMIYHVAVVSQTCVTINSIFITQFVIANIPENLET